MSHTAHVGPVERLRFTALAERYDAILFDAYGVLVNAAGALPGAAEAIAHLVARRQRFLVVTNDASRSPERASRRFLRLGIPVPPEHVLSSGMLIAPALEEHAMHGRRVVVLGTGDSAAYARQVGAIVVHPDPADPADAVVIADEGGFETLGTLDATLSMILSAVERGRAPVLLLANPDLVYPSANGTFGLTAGSLAGMVERALALLLGSGAPRFEVLGKPAARHFETALAMVGTRQAVMLGDTLHTDIAGAHGVGIASAIVLTGVTTAAQAQGAGAHAPTYLLDDLRF
ncbi:HAD hydrolase-like protein [Gemmatimonas sp.]|uniref:HAD-IIA family hydrolase n=1 Tax=Gemmatimonas sp. TaxID=1962908 RepID=UPI0025C16F38|nr:HAD hydrolase-like protein [Gemmatimonas sp.]MCA2989530.1 HAD hydrolase-like protein [Gemmatimonas sp.]